MRIRPTPLVLCALALFTQSCSLVFSADEQQCDIDEDCASDGGGPELACVSHVCLAGLVVNEVQSGSPDWAEIVNNRDTPMPMAGYRICDDHCFGTPADFETALTFPADLVLEPGEHFIITFGSAAPMPGIVTDPQLCIGAPRCVHQPQGLNSSADSVLLYAPDDGLVDSHAWQVAVDNSKTRCRIPDGVGAFTEMCERTPGASN